MWLVIMIITLMNGTPTPGSYLSGPYANETVCEEAAKTQIRAIMKNPAVTQNSYRSWLSEVDARAQMAVWAATKVSP